MNTLIFGRSGQVASALLRHAPEGAAVTALGRSDADLARPESCAAAIAGAKADLVINAAAFTAVDRAETEETLAHVINADAPGAMARACAARGIPFVHISTDYVFDGSGTQAWRESDPVAPLGAYGRSKLAGERTIAASGAEAAILRTSWVFSAHGANFVKTMLRLAETRDRLTVVADQIGGPTAAGDIAQALWAIGAAMRVGPGGRVGGLYHFSGAPDVSWADFAREIFAQAGRQVVVENIPTSAYPTPATRPANSRLDCSKIAGDLGIARPDWRRSLSAVLAELSD